MQNSKSPWKCSTVFLVAALALIVPGETRAADGDADAWRQNVKIESKSVGSTPNVSTFGDRLFFAGQPQAQDFKTFADLGVKTVLNLRTEPEMAALDFDEEEVVGEAGMKYISVPIGREAPTAESIKRIMDTLDTARDEAVLLHCASSNRVGYIWSMYRAQRHGLKADDAIEEGKKAGMKSPTLMERARKYMQETGNHNP